MDRILRSGLWWIPLVFGLIVAGIGGFAYRTLADSMRDSLNDELKTILGADVAALRLWVAAEKRSVETVARDAVVLESALALAASARQESSRDAIREALLSDPAQQRVMHILSPARVAYGHLRVALLGLDGLVLASENPALVGQLLPMDLGRFRKALEGESVITHPMHPVGVTSQAADEAPPPVVRLAAPVFDREGQVRAVLGFSMPGARFGDVMRIARKGESGETYAFDRNGVLLSQSRFDEQLVELGLLGAGQHSILTVEIRDPGGDMTQGFVPTVSLRARPLTRMAAAAISAENGSDIDGYPDYRGVPVVGAWIWMPDLEIGITTEIDVAEAYRGLATVRRSFAAIAGALGLAALCMLGYTVVIGRLQSRYEKVRKLGRYEILEKIGEGGMGKVYRAKHALLRRPTAVKLLEPGKANEEAVTRFEREVQATASLTHPNTVAIFDFGRTPSGAFYYAMEYLEGITVAQLVGFDGPQTEARALHILLQAAGSLAEAHAAGLIHRDLKPSNLMLCRRGGLFDFVKVLDFGLVRAENEDMNLTGTHALTGTPLFLSPEALEDPAGMDARSDVYQLGAVLYLMLTGRPVFEGETLVEILSHHLGSTPTPPSEVLGRQVDADLEKLLMICLSKDREQRPADGAALFAALEPLVVGQPWTQARAAAWWEDWALRHPGGVIDLESGGSSGSLPSGWDIDVSGRMRGSSSR